MFSVLSSQYIRKKLCLIVPVVAPVCRKYDFRIAWHKYFGTFSVQHRPLYIRKLSKMKLRVIFLSLCSLFISLGSIAQKQKKFDLKSSMARGQDLYAAQCMSCHLEGGEGIEDVYPPLAKSDYLMADKDRSIHTVIHGLTGEIVVNGKSYNMDMTPFALTDEEVSDVLNYIRNSWGNKGEPVTAEEVRAARNK
jgi:nitrite reductase (NO-forming)